MPQSAFLKTALAAARAGEAVIRKYWQQKVEVELKEDQSPVTVADVETEQAIKAVIVDAFPEHGFYGEETGKTRPDAEYTWLVDPIDGTKSFVREYPFFSTQIALMKGDEFILGVSNAPVFGEMAWAERGQGAFWQGQSAKVSQIMALPEATLSIGNIKTLAADPSGWAGLSKIVQQVNRIRGYGDFYHYHLLARGSIDLVIESDVNILDVAALSVIVQEAGGIFTDLDGNPLNLNTTTVCAGATSALHQTTLKTLGRG
ncbi:MAG TPA: inositol-phosphate phosphatase [Halothiobacillus sp.]|nr:inositol-phosphate phosphatase [Halothiobacillus sp.]